jgi:hypothetical protein
MSRLTRLLSLILVLALLQGCGGPAPSTPVVGESTSPASQASPAQTTQAGPTAGANPTPGTYFVGDPAKGLDSQAAYRATLTLSFSGTQSGKSSQWSQSYDLTVAKNPKSRLLAYQESGLDPNAPAYPALEGVVDGVLYTKALAADTCAAAFVSDGYDPATLPEPASLLPKIRQASPAGAVETIGGQAATPYSFEAAAVTPEAGVQGSGKVWLAADGSTILKYSLALKGGSEFFGDGSSGSMTWEYTFLPVEASLSSLLPAGCPRSFAELPVMADAKNILRFPGFQSYETSSKVEDVANFYLEKLPAAGFTLVGDARIGTVNASLAFSKDDLTIDILVESGEPAKVSLTRQEPAQAAAGPAASPTPNAAATSVAGSPQMRVANALTLLNGSEQTPSVFASYHLEYSDKAPKWDGSKVVFTQSQMSADVEGKNIHFITSSPDNKTASDIYLMGDQEYELKNGKAEPGLGMAGLAWVSWPLDVVMALSIGSLKTTPAGTETLDGRSAEVYQLDGKVSDDPTGMLAGMGFGFNAARGTVWVDAATGALVKAVLDYEKDVKDTSGAVVGQGNGHMDITITGVGKVTVKLP